MKEDAHIDKRSHRSGKIVRHLSPFRYPGGKSWLADHVRLWLKSQANRPKILVEPFGGGAGTSLISVNEGLVEEAVFAEIDPDVAATWETVLNGHATWLANKIRAFRVTRKNVERVLSAIPQSTHERAFQCILQESDSSWWCLVGWCRPNSPW